MHEKWAMDSSEKGSAEIIKSDSGQVIKSQRTLVGMQTVRSSILRLSIINRNDTLCDSYIVYDKKKAGTRLFFAL